MKLIAAASYQKSCCIFLVHEFFVTDQDTTGVLGGFCCKNPLTGIRLELKIRQFWSLTRILQEYRRKMSALPKKKASVVDNVEDKSVVAIF